MTEQKEFTANENTKITYPKQKSKRKIALLISLVLCLTIILSIPIVQYITAPKTAENAVAVYLTKNNNFPNKFMSFKETYHTVEFNGTHYLIELSGSANVGPTNKFVRDFYAKVTLSLFSNNITIEKLTFDGSKIVK
ncbi:MAG: hypothetical protein J6D52_00065 [Clostridia bacterium]|nr:hypothetical protein [Clostridia bacterium]